ncbi:MAG: DUF63 family protein [Candidatus Aenigmarchaeota archaeon]|nr:DUF63 family protein [Candidatus Aenigmarchaeota archaeon]
MAEFFQTYFVDPIIYNTGYNIVNTVTFALILIAAVFLTYKLLKRMKIAVDRKFFFGILPFIAMGSILRAFEDLLEAKGIIFLQQFTVIDAYGAPRNVLFITPLIYFVIFGIALAALVFAKLSEKKIAKYWKTWFAIGLIIDLLVLTQFRFVSAFAFGAVILLAIFWALLLFGARRMDRKKVLMTNENTFLIFIHMFDASTTFTALQFPQQLGLSYFEQHVVAGFAIDFIGPAAMFLLKIIVVPLVLYFFDKELHKKEDLEKRTFLKTIVVILGMGPGLRNWLRMIMGV